MSGACILMSHLSLNCRNSLHNTWERNTLFNVFNKLSDLARLLHCSRCRHGSAGESGPLPQLRALDLARDRYHGRILRVARGMFGGWSNAAHRRNPESSYWHSGASNQTHASDSDSVLAVRWIPLSLISWRYPRIIMGLGGRVYPSRISLLARTVCTTVRKMALPKPGSGRETGME